MSMALIEPIILWPLIANFGPPLYLIETSQLRVCILVEQLEMLVRYTRSFDASIQHSTSHLSTVLVFKHQTT